MIVAISQRNIKMSKGANRDALENDYIKYYENFGIILLPIPNVSNNLEKYFSTIPVKGIILAGGNYINPALYGGKPENEDYSEQRDNTEKKLVETALEKNLPLLGVCRGAQFINVYFGGSLIQNIKEKIGVNHVATTHKIKIIDRKATDFFNKNEFIVNSYHNQGFDNNSLSSELKPFAISGDGIIEGIYHPKHPIAGVLWHPERSKSDIDSDRRLIEAFVNRKLFWKIKY